MSTERWRDRVRDARRELDEARRWRQQVDDDAAEQRVKDAYSNLGRALSGQRPMPPEVREAQRRLDEFCEDHPYALDDDPVLMARNEELQAQVYAAERETGYSMFRGGRSQSHDDGEVFGDWFAERRAKAWGVIQPDGSVVAKGFVGDDDAEDDMAVHPPGAIAYYSPERGWTNAATGHPASEGPATPPARPVWSTSPTRPEPPRPAATTPPGGTGMTGIVDARGSIMSGHQSAEQALNELMQAHRSLEDAQNSLRQGTEGSNQAEADQAHAQLTEALSKIDEARQQVASALQEFEGVAQRL